VFANPPLLIVPDGHTQKTVAPLFPDYNVQTWGSPDVKGYSTSLIIIAGSPYVMGNALLAEVWDFWYYNLLKPCLLPDGRIIRW
jgi:hypothetical protein